MRVSHNQIEMDRLVYDVKKRECRGECENVESSGQTKQQDNPEVSRHNQGNVRLIPAPNFSWG